MEAKRGPTSGEKAGNANVAPVTPSEESSSSTKKNTSSRPVSHEATSDAVKDSKTSLFFEHPDDPKNNANKIDRDSLFSDEKTAKHEDHEGREDQEKVVNSTEQSEKTEDHETAEAPLTSEQELQVVEEYTRDRLEVVDTELAAAEKNSADAFIAQADKVLLEHIAQAVHERTNGAVASSDEILDSASVKAEAALQITHDVEHEDASHEMSEAERDDLIDSILHGSNDTEMPAETYELDEPIVDADSSEPDAPAPLSFVGGDGSGGGPIGPASAEYSSGEHSDDDHTAYSHAVGDASVASGGVAVTSSAGTGGAATASSEAPKPVQNEAQRRHDFNNGLLIGGVLGYVVGRHHGRKKAERAIKPELVRHKKEVDALQQKIIAREQHIRSLAANKVIAQQVETHTQLDSHKEEFGKATLTSKETAATPNPKLSAELVGAAAVAIGRPTAAEAAKPEQVVAAAQARNPTIEQAPSKSFAMAEAPAPAVSPASNRIEPLPKLDSKGVAQLPQRELENVAETIPIKGQTLRKIYESGQVDKQSLRRIVTEYVRTGKVERLVEAEVAATKFRKRSPELTRGAGGVAALAIAEPVSFPTTTAQSQAQASHHDTVAASSAERIDATNEAPETAEKMLNGKVVIVAAVILAIVVILLVSRRH